jgi:hypothetical protein
MQLEKTLTVEQFQQILAERIAQIDLESLKADILPFVADPAPIQEWSKEMLNYFATKMQIE